MMAPLRLGALAVLAVCAFVSVALAKDLDALSAKGKELAEANCTICHAIAETGSSPLVDAPPFRDIAVIYDGGELEDAFNDGVATDHPAMPDWQMTPDQAAALASYIMGLAPAGQQKSDTENMVPNIAGLPAVNP